jgi:hypothetical protein
MLIIEIIVSHVERYMVDYNAYHDYEEIEREKTAVYRPSD